MSHQEAVREHYRKQGREQVLAFLVQKGVVRESMFGDGFVAVAEYLPEGEDTLDWKAIDLPKDLTAWQPKKEEEND